MRVVMLYLFMTLSSVYAGLEFKSLSVEQTAKPEDSVMVFSYPFTNTSEKAVTIGRFNAGCSCLEVKDLTKKTYQPGESGVIELDFALGTFTGKVEKTMYLWYEGVKTKSPSFVLRATVNIPVLFEVEPKTLKWAKGAEADMKIIRLSAQTDNSVHISNIICTNPNFKVELVTKKEGYEYEFEVTPLDMEKVGFGIIKFDTDSQVERFRRGQAFMVISRTSKP